MCVRESILLRRSYEGVVREGERGGAVGTCGPQWRQSRPNAGTCASDTKGSPVTQKQNLASQSPGEAYT